MGSAVIALGLALGTSAAAQRLPGDSTRALAPHLQPPGSVPRAAPLITHMGAAGAGSLAGLGLGVLGVGRHERGCIERTCDVPGDVLLIAGGTVAGAIVGDQVYGAVVHDRPSLMGGVLGSLAGLVAGAYVGAGLSRFGPHPSDALFISGLTVTDGAVAAWAGRAARGLHLHLAPRPVPAPRAPPPDSGRTHYN